MIRIKTKGFPGSRFLSRKDYLAVRSTRQKFTTGFTLIEIMIAISIFSVIMVISMGSVLSVLGANAKSGSLRAVMDNLNSTLESMTRTIRFGQNYNCGSSGNTALPQDCPSGSSSLTVLSSGGNEVMYQLSSGAIVRSVDNGTPVPITSPDVTINKLTFLVFGSAPYSGGSDLLQPQVIMVVGGVAGTKSSSQTAFTLETTVSQRLFDFQ